jgi:hypothetical protein
MPNRRRSSVLEIPPSFSCRARERSIKARNWGWLLSRTVSQSAFSRDTKAATGLPFTLIM